MENIPIPAEIRAQWDREVLDDVAHNLFKWSPFPSGHHDITVRELCPDLTEAELDYVMSKYTGTMERG